MFLLLAVLSQRQFTSVQSVREVLSALLCNVLFGQVGNIITSHSTEETIPLQVKRTRMGCPGGPVVKNPPSKAGTEVQSLVQEDSTCRGTSKPMGCNY